MLKYIIFLVIGNRWTKHRRPG